MIVQPNSIVSVKEYSDLQSLKGLAFLFKCEAINSGHCLNPDSQCCGQCAKNYGFLKFIKESDKPVYNAAFDEQTGFLGDDGCRLPTHLRSATCLTHLCEESKQLLDSAILDSLKALRGIMLELEEFIKRIKVK